MGRPPIGDRAMTGTERQRRYLTRLRGRAGAQSVSPQPQANAADVVRIEHFKTYPGQILTWLAPHLSTAALRTMRDTIDRHLAGRLANPRAHAR